MSNTIGRVDFTATIDGRRTPQEAENVGRKAGAAAGDGYDKEWKKSFKDTLTESGKESYKTWTKNGRKDGGAYGDALSKRFNTYLAKARQNFDSLRLDPGFLDDFLKKYDDAGLAAGDLQKQLKTLREENKITASQFEASKRQVDEWALSQKSAAIQSNNTRDAIAKLNDDLRSGAVAHREYSAAVVESNRREKESLDAKDEQAAKIQRVVDALSHAARSNDDYVRSSDKVTQSNKKQGLSWGDLSANTRQWTLIISAIAAAAQDIAVLGSAAGAGLLALGGAATSAIAGLGAGIAVFSELRQDVSKLPADLRPVAEEFQHFTKVFGDMRETISRGAFGQISGDFDKLGGSLRSLDPELTQLGRSVGNVFDAFVKGTSEGSDGLNQIRTALRLAGPTFESLAGSAGSFAESLLRGFNRANPLVQELTGYIAELARRFDMFTRSSAFDDWMRNADTTFGHLGPLIDAAGRALNDLVTPQTVTQTAGLLDNLTKFMPILSDILSVLGSVNPFGLLSQALLEAGNALDPLLPALDDLAQALSTLVSQMLPPVATALSGIATVAAPVASALANIISALPEPVIIGITDALLAWAAVWTAGKVVGGISAAASALSELNTKLFSSISGVEGFGGKVSAVLGKAGAVGAAIGVVAALEGALVELSNSMGKYDDNARNAVATTSDLGSAFRATLKDAQWEFVGTGWKDMSAQIDTATGSTKAMQASLTQLVAVTNKSPFERWIGDLIGVDKESAAVADAMGHLGEQLGSMPIEAANDKFRQMAVATGATDEQILALINSSGAYKANLKSMAEAGGQAASDQDLLNAAMGRGKYAADAAGDAIGYSSDSALTAADSLTELQGKMQSMADTALSARSANRDFQAAVDDLTKSVQDNGTSLDITTEAGRSNEAAIDAVAQSAIKASEATLKQTGSQDQANAALGRGYDALIELLGQFGITGAAADAYARKLGLIPSDINTNVTADTDPAQASINKFIRDNNGRTITIFTNTQQKGTSGKLGQFASGGMLYGPQHILAGEAGAEAIVPLDRPLGQVDSSVRWLAAIAQGKTPAFAGGGVVGGGKQVTVSDGAIVINESGDPRRSANEVLQRLAEQVAG